jgi:sugar phosphate isomerase/epimerase
MDKWPIGVFTSVDAGLGVSLDFAQQIGVPTVQVHTPHKESRTPEKAEAFRKRCDDAGIKVTAFFGGFEGESYADIPTVKQTVGLMPKTTRAERLVEIKEIADFAKLVGVDVLGLHIGFVPHEKSDPDFAEIVAVTQELCDHCKAGGQNVHLETGQEPADALLQYIDAVGRDNLFINFDPANMILYGCGEPIEALQKVGHLVRSVHCKDAKWAARPGQEWGEEVPLGAGDVNIERYLRTLAEVGYTGPLTIEREIAHDPPRQQADVKAAVELLEQLKAKIG